jgi:DNA-binding SARP family transcriptional activator/pimeloyl-ACP methyl ester carboxylesterase
MLRVNLFGTSSLDNGEIITINNRKAQALLAVLALAPGQFYSRERLATLLWPDSPEGAARQSLRQCISVLRRDVPDLPLVTDHDRLTFAAENIAVDVAEFETLCADRSARALRRVATLYRGDLLEGFDPRSDRFEAWLIEERIRLRTMATSALRMLLDYLIPKKPRDEAYGVAHRLLAIDPLQEDVHRTLMRMHFDEGQTTLALRQFKRCETILRNELDIEPDAETKALHREHNSSRARRSVESNGCADTVMAGTGARAQPRRSQTIEYCTAPDGVRIAYASVGRGPPLVKAANWFNHLELDFTSSIWCHWLDALSLDHCLLRYDERANGLSDWNVYDISLDAFVSDLETVVDAAGLERFPLLGISQGCAISIAYAAKHPERVSHLVLYGGYAKGWMLDPTNVQRGEALATLIRDGWDRDTSAFRQIFTTLLMPGASAEQTRSFNDLQRSAAAPENAYRLYKAFSQLDVRHLLNDLTVPTLILHARDDAIVKFAEGQELAANIQGARFVGLESQNHLLLQGEPAWKVFISEVRAFLSSRVVPRSYGTVPMHSHFVM